MSVLFIAPSADADHRSTQVSVALNGCPDRSQNRRSRATAGRQIFARVERPVRRLVTDASQQLITTRTGYSGI